MMSFNVPGRTISLQSLYFQQDTLKLNLEYYHIVTANILPGKGKMHIQGFHFTSKGQVLTEIEVCLSE